MSRDEPAIDPAFRADVLAGLRQPQKAVPARWFYDLEGSRLFEAITALPEYYPTRTETGILETNAEAIGAAVGPGRAIVEFGSGSSTKTPHLLRAAAPAIYVPIDISGDFLRESAAALAVDFPSLRIEPLEADFMQPLTLPASIAALPKLGFFPGSTIGNMIARSSVDFLRTMRRTLGEGAMLLIGMDRVKDPGILLAAYNDAEDVTAAFNLNLLHRINRELNGTVPIEAFEHRAIWNDLYARIEMHLVARETLAFTVEGERFAMRAGETIHTENSHKYGQRDARLLLRAGGWSVMGEWTDRQDWFALMLGEARPFKSAP